MNIILLSGGSGKRLWPLSNDIRSKQFIKIFKTDDGTYESMVQRVYRQIKSIDKNANITIATSKTQVSAIHNQLGEDVGVTRFRRSLLQHHIFVIYRVFLKMKLLLYALLTLMLKRIISRL